MSLVVFLLLIFCLISKCSFGLLFVWCFSMPASHSLYGDQFGAWSASIQLDPSPLPHSSSHMLQQQVHIPQLMAPSQPPPQSHQSQQRCKTLINDVIVCVTILKMHTYA